jgi:integrase
MASVSYRKVGNKWHIRFRRKGRKEITKSYPGSIDRRIIQRKAHYFEEQMALDKLDPWENKGNPGSLPLGKAVSDYISEAVDAGRWKVDADGKSLTARTNRNRLTYMSEAMGAISTMQLRAGHIKRWLLQKRKADGKALSPVTIGSWQTTINTFLKWLYRNGYTESMQQITLPHRISKQAREIIRRPKGITIAQLERFCQTAVRRAEKNRKNPAYKRPNNIGWVAACGKLTFWMMLRRREIINIFPEDISDEYKYMTVGNTGRRDRPKFIPKAGIETIPILKPARELLKQMNAKERPQNKPIFDYSYNYIHIAFRRISLEAFNDPFTPHQFRHGGIIHLRSIVKQPGLVSKLARHSSSDVTETHYGGVDPVYLRRAIYNEGL